MANKKVTYWYSEKSGVVVPPRDVFIKRRDILDVELDAEMEDEDGNVVPIEIIKGRKPMTRKGKPLFARKKKVSSTTKPPVKKKSTTKSTATSGSVTVSDDEQDIGDILNDLESK